MELHLKNNKTVRIRKYEHNDFTQIQRLNRDEGWTNLVENDMSTKAAWEHSTIAYIIESDEEEIVGYVRGITDMHVTLYVSELLIDKAYRGLGIGHQLLQYIHNLYPNTRMEMLASSSSHSYYETHGFRPFYGFRKTYAESNQS